MASGSASLSQMLCDAAIRNDVDLLRDVLSKDPFLLVRSNTTSCSPLHIACKEGCLEFVRELLKQRPVLSEDLDSNRSPPLHIASQNGHSELIQPLVGAKPAMCFSRDMTGMTPFHLAAMNGYLPVLKELLSLMPVAAKERVGGIGRDTILHLCVKYNQLEALKTVIEEVGEAEFLNAKNGDGNTILHLAVANDQHEILDELLKEKRLKKNTLNSNGWTAADIYMQSAADNEHEPDDELREKLERAGAFPSTDVKRNTETDTYLSWFESQRSALIVAASLVATVAFQAGINPPGGVWQDTQLPNSTTTAANTTNQTTTHIAGSSTLANQAGDSYWAFLFFNTICLVSAISSIVLLTYPLRPKPLLLSTITNILHLTLFYLTSAYSIAVYVMTFRPRKTGWVWMLAGVLPMSGGAVMLGLTLTFVTRWPRGRKPSLLSVVKWFLPFRGSVWRPR